MNKKVVAIAENGQAVTQEMIDTWCAEYDNGNYFDKSEKTEAVFYGVPNCSYRTRTISFKATETFEKALKARAKELGISASDLCRSAIADVLKA